MTNATQAIDNASSLVLTNDLRDIKPPVAIPSGWEWLWWMLGALALVAVAIFLWRLLRKRKEQALYVPPVPAHVRARQRLEEALALIAQPKPFVTEVSDTARWYLEERFKFRAPERTTEEFLHELQGTDLLLPDQKDSLGDFLSSCDLVKFARHEPGRAELEGMHSSALRLIEETEVVAEPSPVPALNPSALPPPLPPPARKGKTLALAGALFQIAPAVWTAFYLATVARLFLVAVQAGQNSPGTEAEAVAAEMERMGNALRIGLIAGVLGMVIGLAGLVMLTVALLKSRYRAKWFFWFVLVYGVMLLPAIPVGTLAGLFFVVYSLQKRHEFSGQSPAAAAQSKIVNRKS